MAVLDYHAAMLDLYFREKKFSEEQKWSLLESNPFDNHFVEWEKNTIYNNRTFANVIKKHYLISGNDKIREVVVHENCSIAKSLWNDTEYSICPASDNLHANYASNRLMIIKGLYLGEEYFLKKLVLYRIPFIIGTTAGDDYFDEVEPIYQKLARDYDLHKIEESSYKSNTIVLKTKY